MDIWGSRREGTRRNRFRLGERSYFSGGEEPRELLDSDQVAAGASRPAIDSSVAPSRRSSLRPITLVTQNRNSLTPRLAYISTRLFPLVLFDATRQRAAPKESLLACRIESDGSRCYLDVRLEQSPLKAD